MADSRARAGKVPDEPEISYCARKQGRAQSLMGTCQMVIATSLKVVSHWSHLRQLEHPNKNDSDTPEGLLSAKPCAWLLTN